MFQENVWEGGKEGGGDATRPRRREGGHRTLARPGAGAVVGLYEARHHL
jgi:hypothetical protein